MANDKKTKNPLAEIQDLYKKVNSQLTGEEEHQWGIDLTNIAGTKNKKNIVEAHEYINKSETVDLIVQKSGKLFRSSLADKVTEFFDNIEDNLNGKYNLSEIKDEKKLISHTSDFLEVLVIHAMEQNYKSLGWKEEDIKNRIEKIKKKDPQSREEMIQNIFGKGSWEQLIKQYSNLLKQSKVDFSDITSLYRNPDNWKVIYGAFENYVNPIRIHINNLSEYVQNAEQYQDKETIGELVKKYEKVLPEYVKLKRDEKENPLLSYNEMLQTLEQFYQTNSLNSFKPVEDKLSGDLKLKYKDPKPKS